MTREEAIERLQRGAPFCEIYDAEWEETLNMAIEALKRVAGKLKNTDDSLLTADSEACKEHKSKLDLISRQAAVSIFMQRAKELAGFKGDIGGACEGAVKLIKRLPSAEPKTGEWIDDGCIEKCSQCGERREFPHWNYCPNCGSFNGG